MSDERPSQSVDEDLESALRASLRAVAAARENELEKGIADVESILEKYDSLLEGESDLNVDPDNLARRLAACRLELEKLRAGHVVRREAVGRIRLMLLPQLRDSTHT